jgi:predicted alpha/beta hydrolase
MKNVSMQHVHETQIEFGATDGNPLAGTLFEPAERARAIVLVGSATAVPRGFYAKFSRFLAGENFRVLTFDYRGIGGSRPRTGTLKEMNVRMRDWAALDLTAAVDHAEKIGNGLPLLYAGHSFGGQALGLLPNNHKISRAFFAACQIGYWRLFPAPEKYRVWALLRIFGPAAAAAFGYVPGRFGMGEDLPKGVFREWAHWCMQPRYLFDDATLDARRNFPNYRGALRAIGMSDDDWAPPAAVTGLLAGYTGTTPEHITVKPADAGVVKIGHFGFFREAVKEPLWRDAAEWLGRS